jgi:hypothetical protein
MEEQHADDYEDVTEIGFEVLDWTQLAQSTGWWQFSA